MASETDDDIWNDMFHGCAIAAYLHQAAIEQGPPDSEATRQRAYDYYEAALAERNRSRFEAEQQSRRAARHAAEAEALAFIDAAADTGGP